MALFVLLFLNVSVTCPRTSTGEFTFIERSIACVGDVHSTSHLFHCIIVLASSKDICEGRRSRQVLDSDLCSCSRATFEYCFRLRDETRSRLHACLLRPASAQHKGPTYPAAAMAAAVAAAAT
jgi:hypothetical protein